MALIVEYQVVADMYPVGDTAIKAGMCLIFDTDGTVIPCSGANNTQVIGIAGDSYLTTPGQTTAYSASVTIGATDADTARTRWTSNRISDMYNETLASGKITVYNGGGKFWISDDLVTESGLAAGSLLEGNTGGTYVAGSDAGQVIAIAVGAAASYPSGVPGIDTDGSMALSTESLNTWIPIVLKV
jgi:hypothetical protein